MAENSEISWTDHTFNPWQGCTKVSPGCAHCYAETLSKRWGKDIWGPGKPRVRTSAANWKKSRKWNRDAIRWMQCARCGWRGDSTERCGCDPLCRVPTRPRVFSASMADWLDDEVPIEWLADFLELIWQTQNLDYLLLTKRPQNWRCRIEAAHQWIADHDHDITKPEFREWLVCWLEGEPPANVWMGTTVEDQARADERIPALLAITARARFLSCEPLLGPVDVQRHLAAACNVPGIDRAIHWLICGGESGHHARPMHPSWVRSLRDQCAAAGVAFHFKQWGEWEAGEVTADSGTGYRSCATGKLMGCRARTPRQNFGTSPDVHSGSLITLRVGKKAAGRLLDGVVHDAFPEVRP